MRWYGRGSAQSRLAVQRQGPFIVTSLKITSSGGLQAYFVPKALNLTDGSIEVEMVSALPEELSAKVAVSSAVAEYMVDVDDDGVGYGDDSALLSTAGSDPVVLS